MAHPNAGLFVGSGFNRFISKRQAGVLQAGVNRRQPTTLEDLWDAIQESWNEDLTPVMALINAHNGGNNFKLPHTGI